jgi:hypothetical protein
MIADQNPVRWCLWIWWVLGSALGLALGLVAGFAVGFAIGGAVSGIASQSVFGAVLGASTGTLQWVVLRRQITRAGWWVLATTLGMGVAFTVIRAMTPAVSLLLGGSALYGLVNGGLVGILVGTLQALVLRPQVPRAGWWVLTSAMAWGLGFALDHLLGQLAGVSLTGIALVWMLRQPAQSRGPRGVANGSLRRRM